MGFFKRLFSSKNNSAAQESTDYFKGIHSKDYFNERYQEDNINENPAILDGCMKMIESYFMDNKITRKVDHPLNHPINLDQVIVDGMGFQMYCNAFKLEDRQTILFLAFAFSEFLITHYGFKLYKDSKPELPLRSMTLKYDKDEIVLSLYPFEYALKALREEATFEELLEKTEIQLNALPAVDDLLKKYTEKK